MADNQQGSNNGNPANNQQGFTDAQRQELRNLIVEGIAAANAAQPQPERSYQYERGPGNRRRRNRPNPDDPDYPDNLSDEGSADAYRGREDRHFRPEEVGFFNPHLDSKDYGSGDIVDVSGKTYFRDVHLFIDSFKDVARTKAEGVVRRNLNKCLRGVAQDWYIGQLSEIERDHIREGPGVERWEKRLFERFKRTQSSALKALESERYTIQDARNNRETSGFVLNVIRHAKDAGMDSTSAQLTWAWNRLDPSLRIHTTPYELRNG